MTVTYNALVQKDVNRILKTYDSIFGQAWRRVLERTNFED
jgi:hypothetical protein